MQTALLQLLIVGCLACSSTVNALDIYIAFDPRGDPNNLSLLNKVKDSIKQSFPEAILSTIASPPKNSGRNDQIIISLGSESLQQLSKPPAKIPIIAIFISRASFLDHLQLHPDRQPITAVFSDPSIFKQLALTRILYGNKAKVGYFVAGSDLNLEEVIDYSQKIGLSIDTIEYESQSLRADLLKKIDVLLLQNDKKLFKYISLDDLLYITYDLNNTGIIGYSSGLVKSGSVATTYHTIDDILNTLNTVLRQFSKTKTLPRPTYPETYQLLFNKYVIRSLGLSKLSDEKIIDYINQHDRRENNL